jgi:hypothetical protein
MIRVIAIYALTFLAYWLIYCGLVPREEDRR